MQDTAAGVDSALEALTFAHSRPLQSGHYRQRLKVDLRRIDARRHQHAR